MKTFAIEYREWNGTFANVRVTARSLDEALGHATENLGIKMENIQSIEERGA